MSLSGIKIVGQLLDDCTSKDLLLPLEIKESDKNFVSVGWPMNSETTELTKLTAKGKRIIVSLVIVLKLNHLTSSVSIRKDLCFRIYERDAVFDNNSDFQSNLIKQFKKAIDEEEDDVSQYVHVSLKKMVDTQSQTVAIIENNKDHAMHLGTTLQAEKVCLNFNVSQLSLILF